MTDDTYRSAEHRQQTTSAPAAFGGAPRTFCSDSTESVPALIETEERVED
jgi:hypothetical protein